MGESKPKRKTGYSAEDDCIWIQHYPHSDPPDLDEFIAQHNKLVLLLPRALMMLEHVGWTDKEKLAHAKKIRNALGEGESDSE